MATTEASVNIDAPMDTVFQLLVEDRENVTRKSEVVWWEPVGEGPVRAGYRYKGVFIHQRHRCEMNTTVTEFERNRVLVESYSHRCSVAKRTVDGTNRYELLPDGEGTTLILTTRDRVSGILGFVSGLLSKDCSLRGKLEIIRSRAEVRHSPELIETV